ncbi:MAG: response regulator, partial [Planctomycetes bacterium]|nr:response regulator [Planctomycetota bacterium]
IAKILRDFVRNDSYKSLVAGDGRSGVLLAKEYDPSGILLDVGLPDIDGLQVLEQLKFSLETRHIPVQIISGYDNEQSKFMDQGALGYLQKPVNEEQLHTVLEEIEKITKSNIRNILVIEDDEGSRRGISRLLENSNININCVDTGSEGCNEILSKKYDCVILDLSLPDMTGFDVLDNINNGKSNELPPVIIYTGKEITDKEQAELEKYSASTVIKSSGSPERLLDDVSLFLHNVESKNKNECKETIRMLHNEDAMLKDRKILLVDDDMRNTYALSKELIEIGLNVEMAKHGQEAVELLEKDHSYEMVLMDIMMPVMDGYEATGRIRKMQEYKEIPIIAFTAKAMPEERNKCLESGASEYLSKPIDLETLMSLMRIWLFKKQ